MLVVDDGSTDRHGRDRPGTTERSSSPSASNRGLRAGIAAGYREAPERGYAFCGRVDADGQHPAAELHRLLELVRSGSCDVAVGSRFVAGDGYPAYRYLPSPARRFGTALLRRAMRLRLGKPFGDATSGLVAANAKALPILAEPYTSGAPEVEALLRLHEAGLRVEEVAGRHARAGERRVEAPRRQGRPPRRHRDRHAALLPLAPPAVVSRVVVVLGYSDGDAGELHPVCAARLARAAELTTDDDVVVLSGWSRVPGRRSEAELMAAAWSGPARELVLDPKPARRRRMRRTRSATSSALEPTRSWSSRRSWHAARARAAFRWLLRGRGVA